MAATARERDAGDETESQRLTRNLHELLTEIRVAMPGVQVLFAFLLAVPFQARFADVTDFQRTVYFATFVCAGVATACFIAPTAYHRILFRQGEKSNLVFLASRLAIAGLVALACAMALAVILIADVLYGPPVTVITGAGMAVVFAGLWFVLPLSRR